MSERAVCHSAQCACNDVRKLLALRDSGALPHGPQELLVDVAHDPWCARFAGLCCNCEPIMQLIVSMPIEPNTCGRETIVRES